MAKGLCRNAWALSFIFWCIRKFNTALYEKQTKQYSYKKGEQHYERTAEQ